MVLRLVDRGVEWLEESVVPVQQAFLEAIGVQYIWELVV